MRPPASEKTSEKNHEKKSSLIKVHYLITALIKSLCYESTQLYCSYVSSVYFSNYIAKEISGAKIDERLTFFAVSTFVQIFVR